MGNKQAFIDTIIKWYNQILPGSDYVKALKKQLEDMTDRQMEAYVTHLEESGDAVPVVVPNMSEVKIDIGRNIEIGRKLGHEFFQHLHLTDPVTGLQYKTPIRYLVIKLPFRRQQQMLEEKFSIPDTNRRVDELTGQPTGPSKGASITYPEVQVLRSQGAYRSLEELIKYRGGDTRGFQAMNQQIADTGGVSLDGLAKTPTEVKSTQTLSILMKAAHLDNNL